ncbi:hypothetical protein KJ652_00565 [Patescibacteria group bacterium]|nr:hypothetical protein [Patescibacteria group bacterium]MBU1123064.1 hypothetical protein [Patescibacteria group bacterium]MBU1911356.1 hypothetical protein [Patescibacteria group bacterium]
MEAQEDEYGTLKNPMSNDDAREIEQARAVLIGEERGDYGEFGFQKPVERLCLADVEEMQDQVCSSVEEGLSVDVEDTDLDEEDEAGQYDDYGVYGLGENNADIDDSEDDKEGEWKRAA